MMPLLSGCDTAKARLEAIGAAQGKQNAERILPALPDDCRRYERSGVRKGERLDVALLRADQAIGRGNARVQRCANWYDDMRAGYAAGAN